MIASVTPPSLYLSSAPVLSDPLAGSEAFGRLIADANEARKDVAKFFSMVIREEKTQTPIQVAPHQEVIMSFLLAHDKCVVRAPVGCSKTFTVSSLLMWLLGNDPTMRGVIISATEEQAQKPLRMVRDYIDHSDELRLVFPRLQKSARGSHDEWHQTKITVERPYGIRDASLSAIGFNGAILGSRLKFIMVDDILTEENTNTPEQRDKVLKWLLGSVVSRLDPHDTKFWVLGTALHPEDALHKLANEVKWPSLTLRVDGTILIENTTWDTDLIRPATPNSYECRLKAYDPDPYNEKILWPGFYDIEKLKAETLPEQYARFYQQECRDDASAMCREAYIEACKATAVKLGIRTLKSRYDGTNPTFTGVDLAFVQDARADETSFFTFEVRPDKTRVILDIEHGRWDAGEVISKIFTKHDRYKSIVVVETNGAQKAIRDMALGVDKSIPIVSYITKRVTKMSYQEGIPAFFVELMNGAWAIPNDKGYVEPVVKQFCEDCLHYKPDKHASDILMSAIFPWAVAKKHGHVVRPPGAADRMQRNLGATLMSR